MTLDEAIRRIHKFAHDSRPFTTAAGFEAAVRRTVDTAMCGVPPTDIHLSAPFLQGASLAGSAVFSQACEAYWSSYAHPEPEPEWREVETPAVQVAGIDVELRAEGEFVYIIFHAENRGRFRIRRYRGICHGGLVIEREVRPS